MLTVKDKMEEYNRGISYNEKIKCESENEKDVNGKHRKDSRRTKSLTCRIWENMEVIRLSALVGQYSYWPKTGNDDDARRRIINLLMLHAWRRRREHSEEARILINNLSSQVDGLNMQGYLLRQLLDDEKLKTAAAVKDLQKNLKMIEEYKKEIDAIDEDKVQLEDEIGELLDTIKDLKNKCKNQENDLVTARMQAETWEKMLKKDRKKWKGPSERAEWNPSEGGPDEG
ncbi:UNVERIFIED_CONTAM: hypothetical protein PYX00_009389 [Menopon gallinae]|uniref:Uncharacterized protein n=1 Tax=Menopon gallinae TaxID=328185 RepID=A0AAW2HB35_9NEOP